MIAYSVNKWGFGTHMCQIRGSVIPKSLVWAIPCACIAAGVWYYQNHISESETDQKERRAASVAIVGGVSAILGFLLIFRTQKAYGRYWECAMFLQKARGEWFNATSNLVSFCSPKPEKSRDVRKFQQQLVRLISLLFRSAIGEVSCGESEYEVIDPCLDNESIAFLRSKTERCEIVMSWIQRLVVDCIRCNTIEIAPPIVSRVFQEFSLGIVNIASAKKITIIPFPFPYSQMMQILLMFQALAVPVLAGYGFHEWWAAAGNTFAIVLLSWCIHFTACELEMPFGDDANDLPLGEFVVSLNDSLITLMQDKFQKTPALLIEEERLFQTLSGADKISWNEKTTGKSMQAFVKSTSFMDNGQSQASPKVQQPELSMYQVAHTTDAPPAVAPPPPAAPAPAAPTSVPPSVGAVPPHAAVRFQEDSDVDLDTVSRLMRLSTQIENHLLQINQHTSLFPRVDERIQKIEGEVSQIGVASLMFVDRMDRLDKAAVVGRPSTPGMEVTADKVWYCEARRVQDQVQELQHSREAPDVQHTVAQAAERSLMNSFGMSQDQRSDRIIYNQRSEIGANH